MLLLSAAVRAQSGAAAADVFSAVPPAGALATPSGARYVVRQLGTGAVPAPGHRCRVYYRGFLPTGEPFDSTARPAKPLRLRVGRGEVIRGWDELLLLLPAGSRAWVWIPAQLAYGPAGVRRPDDEDHYLIPPNTDLVFDLEVLAE